MIVDIVFKMFIATFFNLLRYFSIEERKNCFRIEYVSKLVQKLVELDLTM